MYSLHAHSSLQRIRTPEQRHALTRATPCARVSDLGLVPPMLFRASSFGVLTPALAFPPAGFPSGVFMSEIRLRNGTLLSAPDTCVPGAAAVKAVAAVQFANALGGEGLAERAEYAQVRTHHVRDFTRVTLTRGTTIRTIWRSAQHYAQMRRAGRGTWHMSCGGWLVARGLQVWDRSGAGGVAWYGYGRVARADGGRLCGPRITWMACLGQAGAWAGRIRAGRRGPGARGTRWHTTHHAR